MPDIGPSAALPSRDALLGGAPPPKKKGKKSVAASNPMEAIAYGLQDIAAQLKTLNVEFTPAQQAEASDYIVTVISAELGGGAIASR